MLLIQTPYTLPLRCVVGLLHCQPQRWSHMEHRTMEQRVQESLLGMEARLGACMMAMFQGQVPHAVFQPPAPLAIEWAGAAMDSRAAAVHWMHLAGGGTSMVGYGAQLQPPAPQLPSLLRGANTLVSGLHTGAAGCKLRNLSMH